MATSAMLLEVAMALANDENEQFEGSPSLQGGVLTPASAVGGALIPRLNALPNFSVTIDQ